MTAKDHIRRIIGQWPAAMLLLAGTTGPSLGSQRWLGSPWPPWRRYSSAERYEGLAFSKSAGNHDLRRFHGINHTVQIVGTTSDGAATRSSPILPLASPFARLLARGLITA
jgi:hypothetical protein